MDPILGTGAVAIVAGYLVAFFKLGAPASPAWALVLASLLAGIGSSLLIGMADGVVLDTQTGAQLILQGVGGAAIAAGLTRTDSAAQVRRDDATAEAGRPL